MQLYPTKPMKCQVNVIGATYRPSYTHFCSDMHDLKKRKHVPAGIRTQDLLNTIVRHSYQLSHWDSFRMERFYRSIPNGVLTAHTKWLLHWFASYSIQYFGTYYTELRHRNAPVCESISVYGYICHISSTPMPESQWLSW